MEDLKVTQEQIIELDKCLIRISEINKDILERKNVINSFDITNEKVISATAMLDVACRAIGMSLEELQIGIDSLSDHSQGIIPPFRPIKK